MEQGSGMWAIFFDVDDNGLRGRVPKGTRVLEIEIMCKEASGVLDNVDESKTTVGAVERINSETKDMRGAHVQTNDARQEPSLSPGSSLHPTLKLQVSPTTTARTLDELTTSRPSHDLVRMSTREILRGPILPESPTVVHVYPPVILSTYQLPSRSRRQPHNSSKKQTTPRHRDPDRTTPQVEEHVNLANLSRLSLSLTANILESQNAKSGSKIKSVLRRLSGSTFRSRRDAGGTIPRRNTLTSGMERDDRARKPKALERYADS